MVVADETDFVVADVPGLIEGAAEGRGLGHAFLRHVERAGVLVHVLDAATWERRDPLADLEVVLAELQAYQADLLDRPAVVFVNKADADPDVAELAREELAARGWEAIAGSAVTGDGVPRLARRLAELVRRVRAARAAAAAPTTAAGPSCGRPGRATGPDFTVSRVPGGWRVTGERVERWVVMLDLDNAEAVAYLQGRLQRAGVEAALLRAGAQPGDEVEIAGSVFDFQPEGVAARARREAEEPAMTARFPRPLLAVVKVGSSTLRRKDGFHDVPYTRRLVDQIVEVREAGTQVVLVTSGAVAAGLGPLGLKRRPTSLTRLQAAASVGQGVLIHTYQEAFASHGLAGGQVLLTPEDLVDRQRYLNARHTLLELLSLRRGPDRQRERHGRHRAAALRRQRPPRRPRREHALRAAPRAALRRRGPAGARARRRRWRGGPARGRRRRL